MTLAVRESVRSELSALLGENQVCSDAAICKSMAVDEMVPQFAAFPKTAEGVASVLHYASEHRLALIPRGRGTKVAMGSPPRQYDIALLLQELRRVIHFEPADLTIGVEAGMTLREFQELVGKHNLWLPLDPRGGGESSIGGIIAANAAGPLRQGYGGPRDMVIGLKIATTDGKIAKTGGRVVKNVAGYDLGKLLTGSLGTLGVIVEANLKLFPRHSAHGTFALKAAQLDIATALRRAILRSPLDPMRMVLLDGPALNLLGDSSQHAEKTGFELWIELGGSHRVIERGLLELRHLASSAGATLERREEVEIDWQRISNLAQWLHAENMEVTVLKAALPLNATEEFVRRARHAATSQGPSAPPSISTATFAQPGVGIANVCVLQERAPDQLADYVTYVRQSATELGGTLVIEHGGVDLKRKVDVWGSHSDDLGAMRKLKSVWDPNGVLSLGRFVDGI
jgi:glycolate oxidase FAD binding subunit